MDQGDGGGEFLVVNGFPDSFRIAEQGNCLFRQDPHAKACICPEGGGSGIIIFAERFQGQIPGMKGFFQNRLPPTVKDQRKRG